MVVCQTEPLEKALQLIIQNLQRLPAETVDLRDGLRRITFSDIAAVSPQPSYDESTRDGYVISPSSRSDNTVEKYKIVGEIPAGKPYTKTLAAGTCCRIMTGGCVPPGNMHVVPFEDCVEENGEVSVADYFRLSKKVFIKQTGCEIARGDKLVGKGLRLQPAHLALLSSSGFDSVVVCTRPSAGFFCTGDELRNSSCGLEKGQKVSSNSFLLQGLLASLGACVRDFGIIQDNLENLRDLFIKIKTLELIFGIFL